jgi:hypothetical protein
MKKLSLGALLLLSGCVYRGAKVTEGTDLALGFTVPGTDAALQFDALNYLTGFRLGVAENAALTVKYSCAETNSYLGCITTRVVKTIDATVSPCETKEEAK